MHTYVTQFVMAYHAEQDHLRALLPEGFESLRPVLRINAEIRRGRKDTIYLELNTPVAGFGKRGWLNIANWESPETDISCKTAKNATVFRAPFLEICFTRLGKTGGCPAESDNDGCFFPCDTVKFRPAGRIDQNKEFCSCKFAWKFDENSAYGASTGGTSIVAMPTEPQQRYDRQALTAPNAAAIPCGQILGAYAVSFVRIVQE